METPIGTIYSTTAIKAFKTLTGLTPEQFLLGIDDASAGNGAKITLADLIASMISSDAGNLLSTGADDLLKAEGSDVSFDDLSDTEKVIFGETDYGNTVSTNLDTITKNGFYACATTATGAPSASYDWFVVHQNSSADTASATQRAVAVNSVPLAYERTKVSSVWGSWVTAGVGADQDLSNLSVIGNAKISKYTPNAINSGSVDVNGNGNLLSYASNNVVFDTDPNIILTDYAGITATLSSIANLAIPASPASSTWNNFLGTDGSTETYTQAVCGKDLLADFSQGNANDNYGLHSVTTIGSPTFAGGILNQVGNSGVVYSLINTFGPAFCYQFKPKSTNTTTLQVLLGGNKTYGQFLQKGTDNKLAIYLSSTGGSHDIVNGTKGTKSDWSTSVEYYIRLRFTGAQYLVDWSLDGTTWTNDITVASTLELYAMPLVFGLNGATLAQPLIGTMDDIQVAIGSPTCVIKNKHLTQRATPLYPVANDTWHDTSVETPVMKKYDGGAWQPYTKVPCGQAITNASGVIASVVQPVLNNNGYKVNTQTVGALTKTWVSGEYTPVVNTPTIVNHNLSLLNPLLAKGDVLLKCVIAEHGYSVGDYAISVGSTYSSAPVTGPLTPVVTTNSIQVNTGAYSLPFIATRKDTGVAVNLAAANWRYVFRVFY